MTVAVAPREQRQSFLEAHFSYMFLFLCWNSVLLLKGFDLSFNYLRKSTALSKYLPYAYKKKKNPQRKPTKPQNSNPKYLKASSRRPLPIRRRCILQRESPTMLLRSSIKASCPMHAAPCSQWQVGSWTSSCWFIC